MTAKNQGDQPESATPASWSNGFTLKKTRDGYSWTISITPIDQTAEAMEDAVNKAIALDARLSAMYGEGGAVTARLR